MTFIDLANPAGAKSVTDVGDVALEGRSLMELSEGVMSV
jgi:hypothetical protein